MSETASPVAIGDPQITPAEVITVAKDTTKENPLAVTTPFPTEKTSSEVPEGPADTESQTETAEDTTPKLEGEKGVEKNVEKKTQVTEINELSQTSLARKTKEAHEKDEDSRSDGEKDLIQIDRLRQRGQKRQEIKPEWFDFKKGEQVVVKRKNGEPATILSISGTDKDGNFMCEIATQSGGSKGEYLPQESVLSAWTSAQADRIGSVLSPEEKAVFDLQVDLLKNGETVLDGKDPQEINAIIDRSAQGSGMLTSDTIQTLVDSQVAQGQLDAAQAKEIGALLSGQNLLDPETALKVMQKLGVTESMDQSLYTAKLRRQKAEETLMHHRDDPIANKEFEDATKELIAGQKLQPEELIPEGLNMLYSGDISVENAKMIRDALITGDMQKLFDTVLADKPGDSDETISMKRMLLEKSGKGAGGMLLIAFYAMREMYKEIKSA